MTTVTEKFTAARARHETALANYSAAKFALDNADAARAALISQAAASEDDVSEQMQLHRASLGTLADVADLTKAILAESKIQMDAAELALLQEQAAEFESRWENVITTCLLKAKDADSKRSEALAAMAEIDAAQQAVAALAHAALRHDVTVDSAMSQNEKLAALHPSERPFVGKRMSATFQHESLRPRLALVTKHGPEMFPFHYSMQQHYVSQLADKLRAGKLMEIVATLSATPAGVV